jgi:sugar/nucleoside kinase (ribokinase family)
LNAPRLVIAGNLLVDDLVFADGRTRMGEAGGAVLYAALAASLWSDGVGCLSRLGLDYPDAALLGLRERGVDLGGVRALGRNGVRTWLLYEGSQWRMVPRLGDVTHVDVSPAPSDVPPEWRGAAAVHIAPMPLACQTALAAIWPDDTFLSLDPHVPIREDTLPLFAPLLSRIDALFVSQDELLLGAPEAPPLDVLRRLRGGRLRYVAWKRGPAGGLLYDARADRLTPWRARAEAVVDPTGCGDAFAASFVTAILDGESAERAVERGIVGARLALSGWGASALLEADRVAANHELERLRRADAPATDTTAG